MKRAVWPSTTKTAGWSTSTLFSRPYCCFLVVDVDHTAVLFQNLKIHFFYHTIGYKIFLLLCQFDGRRQPDCCFLGCRRQPDCTFLDHCTFLAGRRSTSVDVSTSSSTAVFITPLCLKVNNNWPRYVTKLFGVSSASIIYKFLSRIVPTFKIQV